MIWDNEGICVIQYWVFIMLYWSRPILNQGFTVYHSKFIKIMTKTIEKRRKYRHLATLLNHIHKVQYRVEYYDFMM
jgi:hypothetical protein